MKKQLVITIVKCKNIFAKKVRTYNKSKNPIKLLLKTIVKNLYFIIWLIIAMVINSENLIYLN